MRILRPIVLSQALLVVAGKPEMPEGSAVGAQLVGRHPRRREALLAEQLAHELDGRRPVSTTLDQDLEDLARDTDKPQGCCRPVPSNGAVNVEGTGVTRAGKMIDHTGYVHSSNCPTIFDDASPISE